MAERTCVWIKSSLLRKATGSSSDSMHDSSSNNFGGGGASRRTSAAVETVTEWSWNRCLVLSGDVSAGSNLRVKVEDSESDFHGQTIDLDSSTKGNIQMANEWAVAEVLNKSTASPPPDDLITLTHLHEPSVVYCLKRRYEKDLIYTATGPILIALNPFKALPGMYQDRIMSLYWASGEGLSTRTLDEDAEEGMDNGGSSALKPHVFGKADDAFRKMIQGLEAKKGSANREEASMVRCDQSILVSGESGAGKTVTTKHIMKYLASLSARKAEHWKRRRAPSPGRGDTSAPKRQMSMRRMSRSMSWKAGAQIEEKVLESNPILEAFGNARTVRNDNSSRFGKFVELQFKENGSLVGAAIETYLLEKVRLIHQNEGERNYHIFYEMLASATQAERDEYFLGSLSIEDFKMTSMSGTFDRRDGVDDAELFDELVEAMGTMGFDPKTQDDIFQVTVGFLHASNLTFEAVTDDSSKVDESNKHLKPVLDLLGLDLPHFQDALCQFEIEAGNTSYTRTVNKELAAKGLEALIKSTYGAMFDYIVQTVNKKIDCKDKSKGPKKAAYIGVLDIFGFESFTKNSFEQLCINYCNEGLQQQFNLHIFKTEQEEYQREGIEWKFIEFPDNQDVLELIYNRKSTGIISILSDQSRSARGTDKNFADNMYRVCDKHPRFIATALHKGKGQFVIKHYAGPVTYDTEGFVEKNKDEVPRGATTLLESSSKEFVQLLGKISAPPAEASGGRGKKKRSTAGGKFAVQLTQLRTRIDMTSPHYIRCLKPNQLLLPDNFDNAMIADQLRYAGVLEAIRVSRAGYSQRYAHEVFVDRYRFIALDAVRKATGEAKVDILTKAAAKMIYQIENPQAAPPADVLSAVGIQHGNTKVFLRQAAFEYLERFRSEQLNVKVTKIQALARRFLARCRYLRTRENIVVTQACIRRYLALVKVGKLRVTRNARIIQKYYRMFDQRKTFLAKKASAQWFQRMARGQAGRKRFAALWEKRQEEIALMEKQYKAAVSIQCMYRKSAAKERKQTLEREMHRQASSSSIVSDTVKVLRAEQKKAGLRAYQAQAVAKQTKQDANKEVEELRKELEQATIVSEKEKQARAELELVREQLEEARAELEVMRSSEERARTRLNAVEAENAKLKEQLKGGTFLAGSAYTSTHYDDHGDLRQLDERIHNIAIRSKQGRRDLDALVQSLAILK